MLSSQAPNTPLPPVKWRQWLCGLLVLWFIGPMQPVSAHPYHNSFAEIDWSESGQNLEVALRVLPEDLEMALSWHSGRAIVLDQSQGLEKVLGTYLQAHFQVFQNSGERQAISFVGLSVAYDETWLYFEVQATPQMNLRLRNTLLMEVDHSQINRVQPLWASPQDTLLLTARQPEQALWQGN
ncbi:MAG: DUF6702 family protein [Parahaliea sp.]